jgi:hypothetical protein
LEAVKLLASIWLHAIDHLMIKKEKSPFVYRAVTLAKRKPYFASGTLHGR